MASTVSLWFREQMLRRTVLNLPISTNAYLALTRAVPEANTTGSLLDEPPTNLGYSRKSYGFGTTRWQMVGQSEAGNILEIDFGTPTGNWGLIQGWALVSAQTAGQVIASGSLVVPERLSFGIPAIVRAGTLRMRLGDASA